MKELDVLLERYVRSRLPEASADDRRVFERLLELPDPLLADYLFGYAEVPEPRMAGLVAAIVEAAMASPAMAPPATRPGPSRLRAWENIGESPEL
jgi:succinate dehydrogenase flavin-adding protein (antitoxin of CptAB toxin-antitoxin module)